MGSPIFTEELRPERMAITDAWLDKSISKFWATIDGMRRVAYFVDALGHQIVRVDGERTYLWIGDQRIGREIEVATRHRPGGPRGR